MPRLPCNNFAKQISMDMDWDCKLYLLRKEKGKYIPTLVCKFTLFNVSAKQIVDISRKFNLTKYYILEAKKIVYENQLLSRY